MLCKDLCVCPLLYLCLSVIPPHKHTHTHTNTHKILSYSPMFWLGVLVSSGLSPSWGHGSERTRSLLLLHRPVEMGGDLDLSGGVRMKRITVWGSMGSESYEHTCTDTRTHTRTHTHNMCKITPQYLQVVLQVQGGHSLTTHTHTHKRSHTQLLLLSDTVIFLQYRMLSDRVIK